MEQLSVRLFHLLKNAFEKKRAELREAHKDDFDVFEENFDNMIGWLPQLDNCQGKVFHLDDNVYARVIKELGVYDEFRTEIKKEHE